MRLHLPFLKPQGRLQQWEGTSRTPLWLLAGQSMLLEAMAHSVLQFCMLAELSVNSMNHTGCMRHYLFEAQVEDFADMLLTYLAHHELESVVNIIVIMLLMLCSSGAASLMHALCGATRGPSQLQHLACVSNKNRRPCLRTCRKGTLAVHRVDSACK